VPAVKPAPFDLLRPDTVDEAVDLLSQHGDDAKVIAGGQSLIPMLALRLAQPAVLVDVNRIDDLDGVVDGDVVEVGSMVRHRAAERAPVLARRCPLVPRAIAYVGHAAIRSRGTVGGSLVHADPAAELPAVALVLEAEIVLRSTRGERRVAAADFFEGFLTTAVAPDELVTSIRIPAMGPRTGSAFAEFSRRSGDFAVVGAAAVVALDASGAVADARLSFAGVAGTPVLGAHVQQHLVGHLPSSEAIAAAAAAAVADLDPPGDIHGSRNYRLHLSDVLARQALAEAADRARQAA
jgi:CO/xanthine dehydrogenase FAD-binding subunit